MTAKKRKSRKLSAANSKRQPEDFVLYLDRNLGKHLIADALREAGQSVEVHDVHLPIDAPDEEWTELVARRNWIALTKDKNIRYRFAEFEAIKRHDARVIVIRAKNATGGELAEILVKSLQGIQRFAHGAAVPFVAGIDHASKISIYEV